MQKQLPSISPINSIGIRTNIKYPAQWANENSIIYLSGNNVVAVDKDQKDLKFKTLTDRGDCIQSFLISADKTLLAVSETSNKFLPFICIYELVSMRKLKSVSPALTVPNAATSFSHLSFSENGKYLASILGAPHNTLQLVQWEKGQICAVVPCVTEQDTANFLLYNSEKARTISDTDLEERSNSELKILDMSINPFDSFQICVLANRFVKIFNYTNGELECYNINVSRISGEFTCLLWVAHNDLIFSTSEGKLYRANWKKPTEITAEQIPLTVLKEAAGRDTSQLAVRDDVAALEQTSVISDSLGQVTCLAKTPKGFFAALDSGYTTYFTAISEIKQVSNDIEEPVANDSEAQPVPAVYENTSFKQKALLQLPTNVHHILSIATSPSMDSCAIVSDNNQVFSFDLLSYEADPITFVSKQIFSITPSFHHGGIIDMGVACRKPYIATLGSDKTIRIWNYMTKKLELLSAFSESILSLSIHPSGLYLLVGFMDKVRVYSIAVDDLGIAKEINIRACRKCKYSNGGQYFAAVNGNLIVIYCTWTFNLICTLKAHNSKIKSINWSFDDQRLVSCGADGGIYLWNIPNGTRESEFVLKTCSFESAVTSFDGKTVWAIGSDNLLREIYESSVVKEISLDFEIVELSVARTGEMLFCGTKTGNIKTIQLPLTDVAHDYQQHYVHSDSVTKICFSFDNKYVFSCSEDDSVCQFRRNESGPAVVSKDVVPFYSGEILITKADLTDRLLQIGELQRQLEEMKLGQEYQLRLKDMTFNEQMKELNESFTKEIEKLKLEPARLRREKDTSELAHVEDLKALKLQHMNEQQDTESKYNASLMTEFERFHERQVAVNSELEKYQQQYKQQEQQQADLTNQVTSKQNSQLQALDNNIKQLREQARVQHRDYNEMRRQLEEDIDSEVKMIEAQCVQKIQIEHDELARLKGESGIMRKKFTTLTKDIDDSKAEFVQLGENCVNLKKDVSNLENTVASLKNKISEYDELIQQKERKIYELKKNNQEMEKYKFVLDYRIKELKQQIEPRETSITEIAAAIEEMNKELESASRYKEYLQEQSKEQTRLLVENKRLYVRDHQKLRLIIGLIIKMKKDVADSVAHIQDPPLLKKAVVNLVELYCKNMQSKESSVNNESLEEINRQHKQLKKSIDELKKQQQKLEAQHGADKFMAMKENEALLAECKEIRSQLKFSTHSANSLLKASKMKAMVQARIGKQIETKR